MKVSVIVPTYNRAHLVRETIDSILSQTFNDFELIIVDDESTDSTDEVVKSYKDKRIRYFKHQHHGIIAANRNYGIRRAKGKYIAFCDDDDLWFPQKLEKQVQELEKDSQIGLVCNNEIGFDDKGDHGELIKTKLTDQDFTFESLIAVNRVSTSTVLVRKAVLNDVGMMDESPELVAVEDYELWLRIAKKYRVKYIDMPLGKYRTHPGGYRRGPVKALEGDRLIYKKLLDKGVLSFELYQKRINKLGRQILVAMVLTRTGTTKYAVAFMRLIRSLKRLITRGVIKEQDLGNV